MKSICYIIPYFGKLPSGFEMWLLSCKMNPTIDWILFTDDKSHFDYPKNVKVNYCSFEEIVKRIQSQYSFPIIINRPWKLCEFKSAYGEIFSEELQGYDFWGHCDMDLIWGNIRKFITEDILNSYEKIGFQGHSVLYRNTAEVNSRYKTEVASILSYKKAFTSEKGYCFDEEGMCDIYNSLNIPYYRETNFAHLDRFTNSFFLLYLPEEDNYKNYRQIFIWENGKLYRYYLQNGKVAKDEFMYLHLFSRPITFKAKKYDENNVYVIYPDVVKIIDKKKITQKFIKRKGTCSAFRFYLKVAYFNRHKLTLKKVFMNFKKKAGLAAKRGYK